VWAGDDTAVLMPGAAALLLTTDLLVEGIDFDTTYCSGGDVGWKALAASASDIAAMCGQPSHAVVALGLPPATTIVWIDEFLDGLMDAAGTWDLAVVGGDISAAGQIAVTVSMIGRPFRDTPVLRSGARPGDAICVTGALGGAAAGLTALRSGAPRTGPVRRLVQRQLRPTARVAEAAVLAEFDITAMIDVSDGLAVDLGHLVDESSVGCLVDETLVPVDPDISSVEDSDGLRLAVTGGEDFELLFTMRADQAEAAADALGAMGTRLTNIGTVTRAERRIGRRALDDWRNEGWEHLRSR
jgi:thiamine-monophosphate kinase